MAPALPKPAVDLLDRSAEVKAGVSRRTQNRGKDLREARAVLAQAMSDLRAGIMTLSERSHRRPQHNDRGQRDQRADDPDHDDVEIALAMR